jgi:serine/threonine protein kinase
MSPQQKAMSILSATLAIDFIHSKRIVHGDVKPSNELLDSEFHAKLWDFGAARAADGSTMTMTMAYARVELLLGQQPTEKTDMLKGWSNFEASPPPPLKFAHPLCM